MKGLRQASAWLATLPLLLLTTTTTITAAASASPGGTLSRQILTGAFTPPAVFENTNLVRTINLERCYPRESINVVIRNAGTKPEDHYYVPFEPDTIRRIGGFEVKDKQNPELPAFAVEVVESDPLSETQFYRITLPRPLAPGDSQTLAITYHTVAAFEPLPAKIGQADKQFLYFPFSAYFPSTYSTLKQKTKVRFPTTEVLAYTKFSAAEREGVSSDNAEDPARDGKTFTYGPFGPVPAGALQPAGVHYEHTRPLLHISLLERDVEVSHWGGNLATEERYWIENRGAGLDGHFSRVQFQQSAYYNPPSVALRSLVIPLEPGSRDAYFVDDIGNVSTSKFSPGDGVHSPAVLDLKPRYPVFGDWRYKFKIGWDRDLKGALRRLKSGGSYVLRVPFIEGPREREGAEYGRVVSRIILPEGATNIRYSTAVPLVSEEVSLHRTFMDTLGRPSIVLTAINLSDEARAKDVVVTYELAFAAALRKPAAVLAAVFAVFVASWLASKVDVRIRAPAAAGKLR